MTFKELNITEPILKAIKEKGYTVPTPIQEKAIPAALAKRDILGCAQTGTGKTASFAIPIIQHLQVVSKESVKRQGIKALILTPTRELALQISECIDDYSKYTRVRHGVIFGGVNQRPQVDMLRKGIDILVATPGRLLDLMNQGHIHLDTIQYFVLDEADRMLDMGFIHDIKRILPKLPKEKQTLFFSATMPDTIVTLTKSLLKNPVKIYITPKSSTVDSINQVVYFVEKKEKSQLLISILQKAEDQSVLIFSRTKHNADKIVKILGKAGIGSQAIHGNKSQAARQSALGNFKSGKTRVMVATDIASRGIDISGKRLESYIAFRRYLNRHYHAYICTQLLGRCHFGVVVIDAKRAEIPYWQVLFFDKLPQPSPGAAIIIQFVVAGQADINHISCRYIFNLTFQFQFRSDNRWFHNYKVFIVSIL